MDLFTVLFVYVKIIWVQLNWCDVGVERYTTSSYSQNAQHWYSCQHFLAICQMLENFWNCKTGTYLFFSSSISISNISHADLNGHMVRTFIQQWIRIIFPLLCPPSIRPGEHSAFVRCNTVTSCDPGSCYTSIRYCLLLLRLNYSSSLLLLRITCLRYHALSLVTSSESTPCSGSA